MQVYYVDTNVFLRFLLKDNSNYYNEATSLFRKAKDKKVKLLVPTIVIFEVAFVLLSVYKYAKEEIIVHLESLLATDYWDIDEIGVFRTAINLYKSSSNSLVDCFLFAKAQIEETELFTFDKKLQKLQK